MIEVSWCCLQFVCMCIDGIYVYTYIYIHTYIYISSSIASYEVFRPLASPNGFVGGARVRRQPFSLPTRAPRVPVHGTRLTGYTSTDFACARSSPLLAFWEKMKFCMVSSSPPEIKIKNKNKNWKKIEIWPMIGSFCRVFCRYICIWVCVNEYYIYISI